MLINGLQEERKFLYGLSSICLVLDMKFIPDTQSNNSNNNFDIIQSTAKVMWSGIMTKSYKICYFSVNRDKVNLPPLSSIIEGILVTHHF